MNFTEKKEKCKKFFIELTNLLQNEYEVVGSCNNDISRYLVPKGTADQISYYGKPDWSFRFSDHWNWYSNLKKCNDPNYIQCYSDCCPRPAKRIDEKATKPKMAIQVCLFDPRTKKYSVIYGEVFNSKKKKWYWLEQSPIEYVKKYRPDLVKEA